MPGLPKNSASARLLALAEYTGDKLPVALRNEIASHEAALANVPAAINARNRAERDLAAAGKSAAVEDITAVLKHFKTGDFDSLDLGPDALEVATVQLASAKRYEIAVRRAAKAAALNVGSIARRSKVADRLSRYWRDVVLVDLPRDTTSYSEVADSDRRSSEMAARILGCLLVLDQPQGKFEASLLRDAVAARPPALPRLAPILKVLADEKRGVEQAAAASQVKRDNFRAAAEGRTVSTDRLEVGDLEREALAKTAARRSGNLEKASK